MSVDFVAIPRPSVTRLTLYLDMINILFFYVICLHSDEILSGAETEEVAFLVVGDPFGLRFSL